ncbi:MAG TPA: YciI family protein [Thermoleophilaceae bacterium]|nr:YciI family protein [Thermoleophilaceae bacterium]
MAYLYRLLPPRPTFAADMSPAEAEVMGRHVAYWQDLLNRNVAVAFGPVLHPEDPWGLGLLELEDEQAAQAVAEEDPAVATATCTYELVPMQLVRAT